MNFKTRSNTTLRQTDGEENNMIWFLLGCKQIGDKYSEDEMSVYAAQASFFIILAAFPFFMLLLALIQVTPYVNKSDLLATMVHAVPDALDGLVINIIEDLYSDSPMTILSVTAVAALWSSSRGMLSIERGLNRIHGDTGRRGYIFRRILCSGYTILFSLMCVLCLVLLVFGGILQRRILMLIPALGHFDFLISQARKIIPLFFLLIFFLAIYTVLPWKKQTIKSQLPGAVFASCGWSLFSMAFSVYFKYFGNYTVTYGSLTAVILLMLWLYFCICILFLGAEINWLYRFHGKRAGS